MNDNETDWMSKSKCLEQCILALNDAVMNRPCKIDLDEALRYDIKNRNFNQGQLIDAILMGEPFTVALQARELEVFVAVLDMVVKCCNFDPHHGVKLIERLVHMITHNNTVESWLLVLVFMNSMIHDDVGDEAAVIIDSLIHKILDTDAFYNKNFAAAVKIFADWFESRILVNVLLLSEYYLPNSAKKALQDILR